MRASLDLSDAISTFWEFDQKDITKHFELRIPAELQRGKNEDVTIAWLKFAQHKPDVNDVQQFRMKRLAVLRISLDIQRGIESLKAAKVRLNRNSNTRHIEEIVRDLAFATYSFHQSLEKLQRAGVKILRQNASQNEYSNLLTNARAQLKRCAAKLFQLRGQVVHGNEGDDPFKTVRILEIGLYSGVDELKSAYLKEYKTSKSEWILICKSLASLIAVFLQTHIEFELSKIESGDWLFVS